MMRFCIVQNSLLRGCKEAFIPGHCQNFELQKDEWGKKCFYSFSFEFDCKMEILEFRFLNPSRILKFEPLLQVTSKLPAIPLLQPWNEKSCSNVFLFPKRSWFLNPLNNTKIHIFTNFRAIHSSYRGVIRVANRYPNGQVCLALPFQINHFLDPVEIWIWIQIRIQEYGFHFHNKIMS